MRRTYCMACMGAKGKRIYHTCGKEEGWKIKSFLDEEVKPSPIDPLDTVNWTNGRMFPGSIPLKRLMAHYVEMGLTLENAIGLMRKTGQAYLAEPTFAIRHLFESPAVIEMIANRIRELWDEVVEKVKG